MLVKILILLLISFSSIAQADVKRVVETVVASDNASPVAVASQATVYTKSFSLNNQMLGPVGVMYKATSSGTVNLSIQALQSYKQPAIEGTVDSTYVTWKSVETALANQNWHAATLDTLIMPYGLFKVVGGSGNDASTAIQIKVGKQ